MYNSFKLSISIVKLLDLSVSHNTFLQEFRTETLGSLWSSPGIAALSFCYMLDVQPTKLYFLQLNWIKFPRGEYHVYQSLFLS